MNKLQRRPPTHLSTTSKRAWSFWGVFGAVLLLIVSGCGGSTGDGAGSDEVPKVATNQTLNVGVSNISGQVADPVLARVAGSNYPIMWSVGEGLVFQDVDTKFKPGLAESWEISADQLTWTFTLRDGVKMQDGSDFSAQDVETSIDRVLANISDPQFVGYSRWAPHIENVQVIDELHIAITTNAPYAALAKEMPVPIATAYYNKVGEAAFQKNPIAAGAWKFDSQVWNSSMTLKRFDDFWDDSRIANFGTIVLKIIPDETSRIAALRSGQIDIATNLSPSGAKQLEGVANLQVESVKAANQGIIEFPDSLKDEPSLLKDQRVRKALLLAIDREAIADSIYAGYGSVPTSIFFAHTPGFDPKKKGVPYDVKKAKKLLKEAGAEDLTFDFTTYPNGTLPDPQKLAEAVVSYWEAAGVKVNFKVLDGSTYLPGVRKHNYSGAVYLPIPAMAYSDTSQLATFYASDGSYSTAKSDEADALFDAIKGETEPVKIAEASKPLGVLLDEQSWAIPVINVDSVYAMGPKVAQWKTMPGNPYAGPFWYLRAK